ncbi:MAG: FAD-dependent oxidoreductase, partial [Alphaproteobacteria bacterium]|nr:FAD-dependent oxidoreductase [Alphaproteobacteria bacterium]
MTAGKVYVVGAGLSGLSPAATLASRGHAVTVFEAAPQAGGRCRSYFDATLGQFIDNGNHFVLSGNHATMEYLRLIGAEKGLEGPAKARTSFVDIRDGRRWTIAPNDSALPLWLFDRNARVPGTSPRDYLEIAKLLTAGADATIASVL